MNQNANSPSFKNPPSLKAGSRVGLVALASKVDPKDLEKGIIVLQKWGLEVQIGESVSSIHHGFAGTDEVRANDFQTMLDDPSIEAVFSARGGYGSSRIIDGISFEKFKQNPKWIIGFSDITAVHGVIQNLGFQSIHGAMPRTYGQSKTTASTNSVRDILFGKKLAYNEVSLSPQFCQSGIATAPIIGGNLVMLAHAIGSKSDLDFSNKILFIEDIDEYLYGIDRLMVQLKRASKLESLAGLIVGHFTNPKENSTPFGKNATEIVLEHTAHLNIPIAAGFPVGHEDHNLAIPCGCVVRLEVTDGQMLLSTYDKTVNRF